MKTSGRSRIVVTLQNFFVLDLFLFSLKLAAKVLRKFFGKMVWVEKIPENLHICQMRIEKRVTHEKQDKKMSVSLQKCPKPTRFSCIFAWEGNRVRKEEKLVFNKLFAQSISPYLSFSALRHSQIHTCGLVQSTCPIWPSGCWVCCVVIRCYCFCIFLKVAITHAGRAFGLDDAGRYLDKNSI